MPKIRIDREKCIDCQLCSDISSKHFEVKDGETKVINSEFKNDPKVKEAVESCPTEAIILSD